MTSGRGVLVTGGASGIGRAVARKHATLGDRVVVLDRTAGEPASGIDYVVGDVTCYADNVAAVDRVLALAGRLDHFVGNAGIHDGGLDLRATPGEELAEIARKTLSVNVIGYLLGARASVGALTGTGGCMTFTLSDASFVVSGNGAGVAYSASKHGALGLVRHLAAELAPTVRVNAVAPGGVITGLQAAGADGSERGLFTDPDAIAAQVKRYNPLHVMLTPDELADLYLFLASPAARGMTAEVLRPDGGLSVGAGRHDDTHQPTGRSTP